MRGGGPLFISSPIVLILAVHQLLIKLVIATVVLISDFFSLNYRKQNLSFQRFWRADRRGRDVVRNFLTARFFFRLSGVTEDIK